MKQTKEQKKLTKTKKDLRNEQKIKAQIKERTKTVQIIQKIRNNK